MFNTTVTRNDIVQIYEPPVDIAVNAEIVIDVQYDVGNQETYNLMGSSMPENVIADTVSLGVLKGLNSAFPSGLSFSQVQNPPAEIGNAALEIIKDDLLKFFGIVFTSVVVRELKAEIPSFIANMIPGQKPVREEWICPNCQTTNIMKFCSECGTKRS